MRTPPFAAALLLAGTVGGGLLVRASLPPDEARRPRPGEHEEGRAKRARDLASRAASLSGETAPRPDHAEGRDRGVDVLTYDLAFTLDPAQPFLSGTAAIRLMGTAAGGTSSVELSLSASYLVTSVKVRGAEAAYTRPAGRVVVPLSPPLAREERATVELSWQGAPPSAGAMRFFQTATGYAATTVAEPYDAPTFWPCVDDPADRAVVTVGATVPRAYALVSAGSPSRTVLADGRESWRWTFPHAISTYLVSVNVAPYARVDGSWTRPGGGTMPLRSYLLPEHVDANRARLATIPRHLDVLSALFGEYPFVESGYGIVEGHFPGGMEHPSMTSIGTQILADGSRDRTLLLVHELAHQWWGDLVTMRTWDDVWLNEGFATYAEVLYLERSGGRPPGQVLSASYDDGLYAGQLGPAVVAPLDDPFRFTGAVYDKGGWVLHMLRRLVGDQLFFDGLAQWRTRHALGVATRGDLRALYEELSGRELKQFFDQWVETPYRPILRVTAAPATGGTTPGETVTVEQSQRHAVVHPVPGPSDTAFYRFPLKVRLDLAGGGSVVATLDVTSQLQSFRIPLPPGGRVLSVSVDPDGDLLKIVESVSVG